MPKTLIFAKMDMKPVYFNGKRENTFIRTGDGDRSKPFAAFSAFPKAKAEKSSKPSPKSAAMAVVILLRIFR